MRRGTGVDTHHYSEAPGSRMSITHIPLPPTDGLRTCQKGGLSCFPSLIDSGGSPSIKSDRLSAPLNPAPQQFGKAGGPSDPENRSLRGLLYTNVERHAVGYMHTSTTGRSRT